MRKPKILFPILLSFMLFFPGCELVEDIFQAGIWFALIAILVIGGLLYLIFSFAGKQAKKADIITETVRTENHDSSFPD